MQTNINYNTGGQPKALPLQQENKTITNRIVHNGMLRPPAVATRAYEFERRANIERRVYRHHTTTVDIIIKHKPSLASPVVVVRPARSYRSIEFVSI